MNKERYTDSTSSGKQNAYAAIVARIHEHILTVIPPGSKVAIVSKGDNRLLQIDPCRGLHFPQNSEGAYAGYYPENDIAAISHLEALRSQGAQFLVVPVTAFWWFDHYSGFDRHLKTLYSVLLSNSDTCVIFDLRSKQENLPLDPMAAPRPFCNGSMRQLHEVVDCLLPESSTVAVVSRLDTPGLSLGNRPTWRLGPHPKHQEEAQAPCSVSEVARWMQAAMHGGAEFLVLLEPSGWGLADCDELMSQLPGSARLVTYQQHLCAIFEVRP